VNIAKTATRNLVIVVIIAFAGVAIFCGRGFGSAVFLVYQMVRTIPREERRILYHIDHNVLAAELRRFAAERKWNNNNNTQPVEFFYGDDPSLPARLRLFRPGWIQINDDRVDFGCGQAVWDKSLSFGISVWRAGLEGYGTKRLADGVWFYSEDGRVPFRFSFP
jgi:hypothetical protein